MGIRISKEKATAVLLREAKLADGERTDDEAPWIGAIEALSDICSDSSKTHIAFLGTALLAKATDDRADVYAVKSGAASDGAYSARGLGHGVLVPLSTRLGIDLGVSGREPLNNQPYFRIQRATAEEMIPLVKDAKPVIVLISLLQRLERITISEAAVALRSFIRVRRERRRPYPQIATAERHLSLVEFADAIGKFVSADSEGGKRAQATAAGLLDAVFGRDAVAMGRINDPDRHLPGDVGVYRDRTTGVWDRVLEVRDKPISESDLYFAGDKALRAEVRKAAVLCVAPAPASFAEDDVLAWAATHDLGFEIFRSWRAFLRAISFWSTDSVVQTIIRGIGEIRERLIEAEVSHAGVEMWDELTRIASPN